jgi:hypothetical protein
MKMPLSDEWRSVSGWTGIYEVSDRGSVCRLLPGGRRRALTPRRTRKGYLQVVLQSRGRAEAHYVAVLVAAAFIGAKPAGMQVDHKDADKRNNAVENLEYVTGPENMLRGAAKGLFARKLTSGEVTDIKRMYSEGSTQRELARLFGINQSNVSRVIKGLRWVMHGKEGR